MEKMKLINKFMELLQVPEHVEDAEIIVKNRIRKLGLGTECSRCAGLGYYGSYGVCFKCGGTGKQGFRLTKALYEEVEKAVNEGMLDLYLEGLEISRSLNKDEKTLADRLSSSEIAKDYHKAFIAERRGKANIPKILYDLQTANNQLRKDFGDLKSQFIRMNSPKGLKDTPKEDRVILYKKLSVAFAVCMGKCEGLEKQWIELKEAFGAGVFEGEE